MREEIKCKICDKTFKSKSGLAGHMKIEHGIMKRVTYPDEVAKRLKAIEGQLKILSQEFAPQVAEIIQGDHAIFEKHLDNSIAIGNAVTKAVEHLSERISVLEKTAITPGVHLIPGEEQSKQTTIKEQEHVKAPDENGKPFTEKKPRPRGIF